VEEAVNWAFEEHMHAMEAEHSRYYESNQPIMPEDRNTLWCPHKSGTGDKRWPVLCTRDHKYATARYCDSCMKRRKTCPTT
jgi:hypothetical protein